jgi:hypothetical protein
LRRENKSEDFAAGKIFTAGTPREDAEERREEIDRDDRIDRDIYFLIYPCSSCYPCKFSAFLCAKLRASAVKNF